MICVVCKGDEFDNDEQGGMCCRICGTQSQEYFAESFDADEACNLLSRVNGKIRSSIGSRYPRSRSKPDKQHIANADVLDFLLAYQFCLQKMGEMIAGIIEHPPYSKTLKELWVLYIQEWNLRPESIMETLANPTSQKTKDRKERKLRKSYKNDSIFDLNLASSQSDDDDVDNDVDDTDHKNNANNHVMTISTSKHPMHRANTRGRGDVDDADADADADADDMDCGNTNKAKEEEEKDGCARIVIEGDHQYANNDDNDDDDDAGYGTQKNSLHGKRINSSKTYGGMSSGSGLKQHKSEKSAQHEPLFPQLSKPLFLGFLYLAIRILRLPIIPADIVRWCHNGRLPYFRLWDSLPIEIQRSIPHSQRFLFRPQTHTSKGVSTHSISFHSELLAKYFKLPYYSLNTPLVAYRMIRSLGLPISVWDAFCRICQIFTSPSSLPKPHVDKIWTVLATLCAKDKHYPEHIMAIVLCACKMTHNWTNWTIEIVDNHVDMGTYDKTLNSSSFPLSQPSYQSKHLSLSQENVQSIAPNSSFMQSYTEAQTPLTPLTPVKARNQTIFSSPDSASKAGLKSAAESSTGLNLKSKLTLKPGCSLAASVSLGTNSNNDSSNSQMKLQERVQLSIPNTSQLQLNCPLPMTSHDLDILPRRHLSTVLNVFRHVLENEDVVVSTKVHGVRYYNAEIQRFLNSTNVSWNNNIDFSNLKTSTNTEKIDTSKNTSSPTNGMSINKTVLYPTGPIEDSVHVSQNQYLNEVRFRKTRDTALGLKTVEVHTMKRTYLTFTLNADYTGTPLLQYVSLLERCARHLYMSPGLLHELVEEIDIEIAHVTQAIYYYQGKEKKDGSAVVGIKRSIDANGMYYNASSNKLSNTSSHGIRGGDIRSLWHKGGDLFTPMLMKSEGDRIYSNSRVHSRMRYMRNLQLRARKEWPKIHRQALRNHALDLNSAPTSSTSPDTQADNDSNGTTSARTAVQMEKPLHTREFGAESASSHGRARGRVETAMSMLSSRDHESILARMHYDTQEGHGHAASSPYADDAQTSDDDLELVQRRAREFLETDYEGFPADADDDADGEGARCAGDVDEYDDDDAMDEGGDMRFMREEAGSEEEGERVFALDDNGDDDDEKEDGGTHRQTLATSLNVDGGREGGGNPDMEYLDWQELLMNNDDRYDYDDDHNDNSDYRTGVSLNEMSNNEVYEV